MTLSMILLIRLSVIVEKYEAKLKDIRRCTFLIDAFLIMALPITH